MQTGSIKNINTIEKIEKKCPNELLLKIKYDSDDITGFLGIKKTIQQKNQYRNSNRKSTIRDNMAEPKKIDLNEIVKSLDIVIFERIDENYFRTLGHIPMWYQRIFPDFLYRNIHRETS